MQMSCFSSRVPRSAGHCALMRLNNTLVLTCRKQLIGFSDELNAEFVVFLFNCCLGDCRRKKVEKYAFKTYMFVVCHIVVII